ncbi:hypothetical protein [Spirosoma arcticum]
MPTAVSCISRDPPNEQKPTLFGLLPVARNPPNKPLKADAPNAPMGLMDNESVA